MTFREYCQQFVEQILVLKKPATQATVKSHIKKMEPTLGEIPLPLDYQSIQKFFTGLAKEQTAKSLHNIWSSLHMILAQAKREGIISGDIPKPVLPKMTRVKQGYLTVTQMRAIIRELREPQQTFFLMLAETGMRIGEAIGLQAGDILEDGSLDIQRSVYNGIPQTPKTASAVRVVALSDNLFSRLREITKNRKPEEYVFRTRTGKPWWPSDILRHLPKPIGFHAWRRGNATVMAGIGVPEKIAAMRLGHSMPGLTFGLYAQIEVGCDRSWANKILEKIL